jgi:hypothetical protein
MNPLAILALIDASLSVVERAGPILAQFRNDGVITPAQQQALLDRINRWRAEDFSGPEWQIEPDEAPPT